MLRLLDRSLPPPPDKAGNYFRYRHPETGHVTGAPDFFGWVHAAKQHRRANNLPIPADFTATMEAALCEEIPASWCAQAPVTVDTGFSLGDVVDWIRAVANRFTSGQPLVSQEEADRRARICTQCPLNMNGGGCGSGCAKLVSYLTPGMAAKSTAYDDELKACGVCRCANRVQVHFPMDVLEANDTPEKQPLYPAEFCWKSKASATYRANEELVAA